MSEPNSYYIKANIYFSNTKDNSGNLMMCLTNEILTFV